MIAEIYRGLRQRPVSRTLWRMPEDLLTDRESFVLALFRYGLAATASDAQELLGAQLGEVLRICRTLAEAGLLA